jgi:hypothetical protein
VDFVGGVEFTEWRGSVSVDVVFDVGDGVFINGSFMGGEPGADVIFDGVCLCPSFFV